MGVKTLAVIAFLYLVGTIGFSTSKNWPWALVCFGCMLVLIGNIWAIAKA